jgi:hypothetical protein
MHRDLFIPHLLAETKRRGGVWKRDRLSAKQSRGCRSYTDFTGRDLNAKTDNEINDDLGVQRRCGPGRP